MHFQPEMVESFLQLFNTHQNNIRNFDGCHHLELWSDKNDASIFFTFSHWDSEEALNNYRKSELFAGIWSATKVKFSAKPEAWSFDRVDDKL